MFPSLAKPLISLFASHSAFNYSSIEALSRITELSAGKQQVLNWFRVNRKSVWLKFFSLNEIVDVGVVQTYPMQRAKVGFTVADTIL